MSALRVPSAASMRSRICGSAEIGADGSGMGHLPGYG
jgi:hypothetical protein